MTIEQEFRDTLREHADGQYQELPANFFLPVDHHRAWLVEEGKVELFLVHRSGSGMRQYIGSATISEGIFGVRTPPKVSLALVARSTPGTNVLSVSQRRLRSLALSNEHRGHVLPLVSRWIELLASALEPVEERVNGLSYLTLSGSGQIVIDGDKPRKLRTSGGVLWVKVLEGSADIFGGGRPYVPKDQVYFPVANQSLFHAAPGSSLEAITPEKWALADVHWAGLNVFHQRFLGAWISEWTIAEKLEAKRSRFRIASNERQLRRLRSRDKLNEALVHTALLRIVNPLLQTQDEDNFNVEIGTDAARSACGIVFKKLGINVTAVGDGSHTDPKEEVRRIADHYNVRLRRISFEGKWWRRANGYFIAFRADDGRPLAILLTYRGRYRIVNPVDGKSTPLNSSSTEILSREGYQAYRPLLASAVSLRELLFFSFEGCKKEVWLMFSLGIAGGLLGIVPPICMGLLTDYVIPSAEHAQLLQLALLLVTIAVSTALLNTARIYALLRLEGKIDGPLQAAIWDRLLRLPASFFQSYSVGDLADRGMGINEIRRALTGTTLSSILSGFFSFFSFCLLFYYSGVLAMIAAALVSVAFLVSMICGYAQIKLQRSLSSIRGKTTGMVLQLLNGIAKFRVCGAERRAFATWATLYAKQKEVTIKSRRLSNMLVVFNAGFPLVCLGMIFLCANTLMSHPFQTGSNIFQKGLTTGSFIAFLTAFNQFMIAALQGSYTLVSVLNIVPLIERLGPILSSSPEVHGGKGAAGELTGNIEVNHLTFRYELSSPPVLRDVSFSIQAGQCVAILGPSGCGKSTLIRLLLGFEQPECGAIFYDRKNLAGLDVLSVRKQMGVVLQNGMLMDGEILSNIIGSSSLTIDEAWEAARQAGIADDIERMPDGMHTILKDKGASLSGGQRQRIMIARAIATKPRILLFDEGTSALDNRTQSMVTESLANLKATRIIVAHRLSTVMNADNLIVLDKGSIVERGTYDELMAREGALFRIAARQLV